MKKNICDNCKKTINRQSDTLCYSDCNEPAYYTMIEILRRRMRDFERILHKDGDKSNLSPKNLELCLNTHRVIQGLYVHPDETKMPNDKLIIELLLKDVNRLAQKLYHNVGFNEDWED